MNFVKTILTTALALLSAATFAAVDVNKANQAELESIKGIGPSMSAKIIDARKAGAFKDWADMQSRVKGVKDSKSTKFSADGLTVNGSAFQATAATANPKAAVVKAPKASRAAKEGGKDAAKQ
jgi:competence protein ComEA